MNTAHPPAVPPSGRATIIESPKFLAWFAKSKVVDPTGSPLVVYHGTPMDFDRFGVSPMFLTNDPAAASAYAQGTRPRDDATPQPNVIPAYVCLRNPKVYTEKQLASLIDCREDGSVEWCNFDNHAYELESQGYDGVIVTGTLDFYGGDHTNSVQHRYDQYIAFDASQIKSAIGNCGTFDPADERLVR